MDVVDFSKYLYNKLKEREESLTSALALVVLKLGKIIK